MFWPSTESDGPRSHDPTVASTPEHLPVMTDEVLSLLACAPGKNYVDLTVGGGGHAEAILTATSPDGRLVGADWDAETLVRAEERLRKFGSRVRLVRAPLREAGKTLREAGFERVDGALADCGVSSFQLDDAGRGFSFTRDGPLDMRMDRSTARSAREWIARAGIEEIADALFTYGEERYSRRIARAIATARKEKRIETTGELARIVRSAVPHQARSGDIDAATRTFQAIRIVVNGELVELERGLSQLIEILPQGARLVVISFHSLEDRIVKTRFRTAERERGAELLTPKPLRPSERESARNRRSRSARVRGLSIGRGAA